MLHATATLLLILAALTGERAVDGDPIDLGTGLYVRTTQDLVVNDVVPIVFSRTYQTADTRSRPFGVGANHSYGTFLVGDVSALTSVDLILADGGRVHYRRISPGLGLSNAVFRHTDSPTAYKDSVLSHIGNEWVIEMPTGARITYPDCSPSTSKPCTQTGYQDAVGQALRFTHDERLNLVRIQTEHERWLRLEYDDHDRIVRAWTSVGEEARYAYDAGGRLVKVTAANGAVSEYEYDERDQMVIFKEPDVIGVNRYDDNGRCVRQDLRLLDTNPDGTVEDIHQTFTFKYTADATGRITATEVVKPDGSHRYVTFDADGYVSSERVLSGDVTRQP